MHQAEANLAIARDNALFGTTSPVAGERYRLDGGASVGSLRYYRLLGDYRRYSLVARPFSLAGRLVHFGRYGPDGDDVRLAPLFLGYQTLVRGYGFGRDDLSQCPAIISQPADCPVPEFQRLLGSRILVANAELRFPFFEGLLRTPRPAGLPPLDLALFFDAGVAWRGGERPSFVGGSRRPVTSHGAALRVNLFGAAVLELDVVHPNHRPDRGWHLVVGAAPGF